MPVGEETAREAGSFAREFLRISEQTSHDEPGPVWTALFDCEYRFSRKELVYHGQGTLLEA
jgi:hypothetical protein